MQCYSEYSWKVFIGLELTKLIETCFVKKDPSINENFKFDAIIIIDGEINAVIIRVNESIVNARTDKEKGFIAVVHTKQDGQFPTIVVAIGFKIELLCWLNLLIKYYCLYY